MIKFYKEPPRDVGGVVILGDGNTIAAFVKFPLGSNFWEGEDDSQDWRIAVSQSVGGKYGREAYVEFTYASLLKDSRGSWFFGNPEMDKVKALMDWAENLSIQCWGGKNGEGEQETLGPLKKAVKNWVVNPTIQNRLHVVHDWKKVEVEMDSWSGNWQTWPDKVRGWYITGAYIMYASLSGWPGAQSLWVNLPGGDKIRQEV